MQAAYTQSVADLITEDIFYYSALDSVIVWRKNPAKHSVWMPTRCVKSKSLKGKVLPLSATTNNTRAV